MRVFQRMSYLPVYVLCWVQFCCYEIGPLIPLDVQGSIDSLKLFVICSNDGLHLRSARVCCELLHTIHDMLRKYVLFRGYSLFHRVHLSLKRERLGERERL